MANVVVLLLVIFLGADFWYPTVFYIYGKKSTKNDR